MPDSIVLKVNKQAYEGWTDVSIRRSISNICGSFNLAVSEKFPLKPEQWNTRLGDKCSIEINKETVLNGYIDDINISYDANGHSIEFVGRDMTCDLVDCPLGPKQFLKQTLKSVVTSICSSFSPAIEVKIDSKVKSICNQKLNNDSVKYGPGTMGFEIINDLCKTKGILATSYGDGRLVLTRAGLRGKCFETLELGNNILSGEGIFSNRERFSHYYVYGQGIGNDEKSIESFIKPSNTTPEIDNIIKRKRPYHKEIETADKASCIKYAQWEKSYRAGLSRKLNYTVPGWSEYNNGGLPWRVNMLVKVKDEQLGIDKKYFLINEVEFICNDNIGSITKLGLVDPATYEIVEAGSKNVKVAFDPTPHEASL